MLVSKNAPIWLCCCPMNKGQALPDVLITSTQRDPGSTPTAPTLTTPEAAQPLVAKLPLPEEVTERYLEIRTVPEQQVITVIEFLEWCARISTVSQGHKRQNACVVYSSMRVGSRVAAKTARRAKVKNPPRWIQV